MTLSSDEQDRLALGFGGKAETKACTNRLTGIGCGFVFFLVGLGLLVFVLTEWRAAGEVQNWPSTVGIVQNAWVEAKADDDGTSYAPRVAYTYSVNGSSYTSTRITYWSVTHGSHSKAQSIINHYPIHSEVQVYYDPAKPSRAVLDPQRQTGTMLLLMSLGAAFGVMGFGSVAYFLVRRT